MKGPFADASWKNSSIPAQRCSTAESLALASLDLESDGSGIKRDGGICVCEGMERQKKNNRLHDKIEVGQMAMDGYEHEECVGD